MLAYSQPMIPAPTTVSVRGMRCSSSTSSELKTRSPSKGM